MKEEKFRDRIQGCETVDEIIKEVTDTIENPSIFGGYHQVRENIALIAGRKLLRIETGKEFERVYFGCGCPGNGLENIVPLSDGNFGDGINSKF